MKDESQPKRLPSSSAPPGPARTLATAVSILLALTVLGRWLVSFLPPFWRVWFALLFRWLLWLRLLSLLRLLLSLLYLLSSLLYLLSFLLRLLSSLLYLLFSLLRLLLSLLRLLLSLLWFLRALLCSVWLFLSVWLLWLRSHHGSRRVLRCVLAPFRPGVSHISPTHKYK